ncbi:hypothetical protein [Streptomyces sp. NPDC088736]|uniref:hypothetical protein n=1 Tax=Streptomyces sp. NPDC088736 TaxID=3365881 RepID=UPI0037F5BC0E
MRGIPGAEEDPNAAAGAGRKRLELSLPQVAGSAVAAVVAAKLASYFGVYGTILGAGLVSIVATCGGTVFQHFFKRTGEQLRDVTVQAKPAARQTPGESVPSAPARFVPSPAGEFGEGTVYRARVRSWKRPLVAAALVFGVTMAGVTTYELVAGRSFSGDGRSTTVGDAFKSGGSGGGSPDRGPASTTESGTSGPTPSTGASRQPPTSGADDGSAATNGEDGAASPTPTPSSGAGSPTPEATGDGSPTPGGATSPAPGADSRSRSADPGRGGPATP